MNIEEQVLLHQSNIPVSFCCLFHILELTVCRGNYFTTQSNLI